MNVTPEARLSFPYLFEPQPPGKGYTGKPKFKCNLIFEPGTDLSALKTLVTETIRAKWGDNTPPNLRLPFKDGASKAHIEGYREGQIFITVTTTRRPAVYARDYSLLTSEEQIPAGCYVAAEVDAFAYDRDGPNPAGVSIGLRSVMKLRDGEPFGSAATQTDPQLAYGLYAEEGAKPPEYPQGGDDMDFLK